MNNIDKSIADFEGYLAELRECSDDRRREIRRQGVVCGDLMNSSPDRLWGRDDFKRLDHLVGRVMSSTSDE